MKEWIELIHITTTQLALSSNGQNYGAADGVRGDRLAEKGGGYLRSQDGKYSRLPTDDLVDEWEA